MKKIFLLIQVLSPVNGNRWQQIQILKLNIFFLLISFLVIISWHRFYNYKKYTLSQISNDFFSQFQASSSIVLTSNLLFQPNSKLTFGLNYERGSNISLNISSRRNLLNDHTKFKSLKIKSNNRYENLRRILALNNIGVSKISKENDQLHLEITQYQFSTFNCTRNTC